MKTNGVVCKRLQFIALRILFFSSICLTYAQIGSTTDTSKNLYFYGTVSLTEDEATLELTQDLFFSQLSALDLYIIQDKRETVFSTDILNSHSGTDDVLFYAEIYELNGEWVSILHLIDTAMQKEATTKNYYNGYYKILIEAKDSLATLIQNFNLEKSTPVNTTSSEIGSTKDTQSTIPVRVENLSGTWKGEDYIDKIVILRGGRGFVIFENGASMNINVSISGTTMTARQESKSNASFFPDLPREVALVKAINADPIVWELNIEDENSLSGTKHTLIADYDNNNTLLVTQGTVPVQWRR